MYTENGPRIYYAMRLFIFFFYNCYVIWCFEIFIVIWCVQDNQLLKFWAGWISSYVRYYKAYPKLQCLKTLGFVGETLFPMDIWACQIVWKSMAFLHKVLVDSHSGKFIFLAKMTKIDCYLCSRLLPSCQAVVDNFFPISNFLSFKTASTLVVNTC